MVAIPDHGPGTGEHDLPLPRPRQQQRHSGHSDPRLTLAIYAPAWLDSRRAETKLHDVAVTWLDSNPAKRPSSIARDESALRVHVLPALGDRTIGSLTPADIQRCVNEWSRQMAPRSARRVYGTLTAVLNHAVLHDLIARSPCRGIKLPAIQPVERPVLSSDELLALAEALGPEYEAMAYLGAVLGPRCGKCAGLRAGRINFRRSSITVAEQITRGAGGRSVPGPPKSAAGRRTLAVPASLMQVLADQLERRGTTTHEVTLWLS